MPTRIHELVKTYKLINDPNAPNWSIRFVGAIAGVALVVAGMGAILWASMGHDGVTSPAPNAMAATTTQNGDGTRTDYVGFDPSHFDANLGFDPTRVDQAWSDWEAAHAGATVLSRDPVYAGQHVIGYEITYR